MGGSGNDGYEQRQQGIELGKQRARDQLNALFGGFSATPESIGAAPDRAAFTTQANSGYYRPISENAEEWVPATTEKFDEAGYNKALADYNLHAGLGQSSRDNAQNRETLYQGVRDNAYTAGKRKLDEDAADARRKLKFELFATGQAGGSGDIDQNAKLGRTYQQGIMDLGAKADAAKADFRNSDEQTRLQLLQSIDNGMDQGSALSQAAQRMQIASDKAAADAMGTTVGDLFDNAGLIYDQSQYAKGRQAGQQQAFQMFPQAIGAKKGGTTSGQVYSSGAYGG